MSLDSFQALRALSRLGFRSRAKELFDEKMATEVWICLWDDQGYSIDEVLNADVHLYPSAREAVQFEKKNAERDHESLGHDGIVYLWLARVKPEVVDTAEVYCWRNTVYLSNRVHPEDILESRKLSMDLLLDTPQEGQANAMI